MQPSGDEVSRLDDIRRRFGPWMRARVRRAFPRDWEDVMQDAYLRLARALTSQRDFRDEPLRALVSRVVRAACVDEMRRRMRRPAFAVLPEEDAAPPDSSGAAGPADAATRADDIERLRRDAWDLLDAREREILTLRFRDSLGFREIAERLAIPQGSAAGWYSRAVRKLREALQ